MILVSLGKNKVDVLTGIKKCLSETTEDVPNEVAAVCPLKGPELRRLHSIQHITVDRTLLLTQCHQGECSEGGNCNMC